MPTCFALFCTHDSRREPCRMFQFPSNPELRIQWLNNTRRTDMQLKSSSRICSCHFVKGKKHNGPTLFAWTNYITKIRRDLDNPRNGETSEVITQPIEITNEPALEVEVKTEFEVEIQKEPSESHDYKSNINPSIDYSENNMVSVSEVAGVNNSKNEVATSFQTDLKEIESRVNSNHKLVNLRVENLIMLHEIDELQKKLNSSNDNEAYQYERLTFEKLMDNKVLLHCYTGLTSFSVFKFLIYAISESESDLKYTRWSVVNLHVEEQMLITLMKLRCNFGFSDIAYRFRVSSSTVKNIIWTFVEGLHSIFFINAILNKPFPHFIGTSTSLPDEFKNFSNCRIILGSVEVEAEGSRHSSANDFRQRILRGLVGVSPLGDFIFVSELYPENVSLREMVQKSKLLEKLSPGDLILSVENLSIDDILPQNVDLNVPLLIQDDENINERKIMQDIIQATKYLDRAIDQLKRYAILDRILLAYRENASKIFQLCCALVNLENSVIEES